MKILMVNKFLHPNGGSETYIFKLGEELNRQGHEVQFFGMEHEGRIVGNNVNSYVKDMDFHNANPLQKMVYSLKTIYSWEARRAIRRVLDDFKPEVVHLNNFTYQLTPSIIVEIEKWKQKQQRKCRIVLTCHDSQLVCPNHMLFNPNSHELCERCLGGHYLNCAKGKCIHGSRLKSLIGAAEAFYWNRRGIYKAIDSVICPSEFNKSKLDTNHIFREKTIVLRNFIERAEQKEIEKKRYVLYFGRYSEEKGIKTLLRAVELLPDVSFIFAGAGPLESEINNYLNIKNVGFKSGDELDILIRQALFSICPSEIHENCPFSVMESEERGTPVIGARVGGIPELINDGINGRIFEHKNSEQLSKIIRELWNNPLTVDEMSQRCLELKRDSLSDYYSKIVKIYDGII